MFSYPPFTFWPLGIHHRDGQQVALFSPFSPPFLLVDGDDGG